LERPLARRAKRIEAGEKPQDEGIECTVNVGVFGATGQVGTVMLEILAERKFPIEDLRLFASSRSAGRVLNFDGRTITVEDSATAVFDGLDIALFSNGAPTSLELAPIVAQAGAVVIDNSSAWRLDPEVPLVVPEVNASALSEIPKGIVANPNCTTMVVMSALHALDSVWGLRRVVASTYQAVSGAGLEGVRAYQRELDAHGSSLSALTFDGSALDFPAASVFPATIAANVIPFAGSLVGNDTSEELKFVNESRKILGREDLLVSVTCVRVPVFTGHSLSLTVELETEYELDAAIEVLSSAPGVRYCEVPTPLMAAGSDECLVGRVRRDNSAARSLSFFAVGDNLRKGAALNAVQIAECLERMGS
jgi:aspartate-semialdehyde dehydrogenase